MRFRTSAAAVLAGTSLIGLLYAAPAAHGQNLLVNGSFENGNFTGVNPPSDPGATQLQVGATNMTGWTTVNAELAWIGAGNPYSITASEGVRSLDLSGYHDTSPYGGVSQGLATTPGSVYNLAFDLGSVIAGNTVSLRATAGGVFQDFTFTRTGSGAGQQWGRFNFDFTALTSSTTITLTGLSATSTNDLQLDNAAVTFVRAGVAVPEPGSVALLAVPMALALLGAGITRRRQRNSN